MNLAAKWTLGLVLSVVALLAFSLPPTAARPACARRPWW